MKLASIDTICQHTGERPSEYSQQQSKVKVMGCHSQEYVTL